MLVMYETGRILRGAAEGREVDDWPVAYRQVIPRCIHSLTHEIHTPLLLPYILYYLYVSVSICIHSCLVSSQ